jgi:antitoxin component YwqK of YwqJK toxin-antitoxin module
MAQRERLLFKQIAFVAALFCFFSCTNFNTNKKVEAITSASFFVDTTGIPKDSILSTTPGLKLDNGLYLLNNKPFSGCIKDLYENKQARMIAGYLNGMQHGNTVTFYEDGKLRDSRSYKENKSFGKHFGYWQNGNQKFEFYYLNDKREGTNKQWYESGKRYAFLNFKDDKEYGMQQAWRENGKPYINYEAKEGFRYGLQKSGLCFTLKDEKFKIKE